MTDTTEEWVRKQPLRMEMAKSYDAVVGAAMRFCDGKTGAQELHVAVSEYRQALERLINAD